MICPSRPNDSPRGGRRVGSALWTLGALAALSVGALAGDELDAFAQRELARDARDAGIGTWVPELRLTDLEGRPAGLLDALGAGGLVIAVRRHDCPVSARYGPVLAELEREFAGRDVGFVFVHVGPAPDPEALRAGEVEAFGFAGPYLLDEGGQLAATFDLRGSATALLLDGARTLQYRGMIDDRCEPDGTVREAPTREYLRDALDSISSRQLAVVPATVAPGAPVPRADGAAQRAPADERPVTFHREVARIFQTSCVECHHEAGPGPFALTDYRTAYDKRRMIGLVVEQGIMPPWYASPEHGSWRGDRSLTATARAAVLDWVAAGAPEGDVAETPIRYEWSEDWAIGEPDEIFQLKRVQEIPAEGVIDYRLVPGDRIVERDMWVERMQVLPTDKSVVHHASVFFQEPLSGEAPVALVDALVPWQRRKPKQFGPKQLLWGYAPGRPSSTYEPGVARYLPKGSRLLFEMHYTTQGVETTDQTRIGLVLARRPPRLEAETHALAFEDIDIEPGGTAEYSMEYEFEYPVRLRALVPHMHYRGSYFWADLIRPDGSEERLIEIPTWDFDWQHSYVFRDGPFAPAGTRIRMTGGFDNTVSNVDNPDPARRVPYGVQSWDEMLKLGVEWVRPLDGESP